jgi:hypothetical protein
MRNLIFVLVHLITFSSYCFSQDHSKWIGIYNDYDSDKQISDRACEIKIYYDKNDKCAGIIRNQGIRLTTGEEWESILNCRIDFISNMAFFYDLNKSNDEIVLKLKDENNNYYMETTYGWIKITKTNNSVTVNKDENKQWVIDNILDLVEVDRTYTTEIFGTSDLIIFLDNKTGYKLDYVVVKVNFYGSSMGTLYCSKEVVFDNIEVKSLKNSLPGPSCDNGKDIKVTIKQIISSELNLDREF